MKRFYLFVLAGLLSVYQVSGQDYLISFAGSGAAATVDSVQVKNLIQQTSLTVDGSDILNLVLVVGIPENKSSHDDFISIRPNPVLDKGYIEFEAPARGVVSIIIADVAGSVVAQSEQTAQAGFNVFWVSGLRTGIYSVIIHSASYMLTGKLISTGAGTGTVAIGPVLGESKPPVLKVSDDTGSVVQMQYNNGEQLIFTGYSGTNATVMPLVPAQSSTLTFEFMDCTDTDGHHYPVVRYGTQMWMAKNLNVGTRINGSLDQTNNGYKEKYCYNDQEGNCDLLGGLYQRGELMQYEYNVYWSQGVCPGGWHIPRVEEWTVLSDYLGAGAGGKMKETGTVHWASPNSDATNSSGFTALPAGYRYSGGAFGGGGFDSYSGYAIFGVAEDLGGGVQGVWYLRHNNGLLGHGSLFVSEGVSCRCTSDQNPGIPTVLTTVVTDITGTTATGGGNVTSDRGSPVTARGVCWSAEANPTISGSHTTDGSGLGSYSSYLTGLTPDTVYYVRAYATNGFGTAYGELRFFTADVDFSCPGIPTVTYEGQVYGTVKIGDQCWFRENLNVGTRINGSQNQTNNGIIEKYCYNDDQTNCAIYGGLYQWDELMQYVTTEGDQGLCPTGWHLPTDAEWTTLSTALGGNSIAGGKMKEAGYNHWRRPNTGATNSSGFTALPGGYLNKEIPSINFNGLTRFTNFWSSTEYSSTDAGHLGIDYSTENLITGGTYKIYGFSCRCIKD